jgi:glycosyltransferase involved in cell wall biosynthesis
MTEPRYSLITPTLVRDSLKRLCDSIDMQTFDEWEHIVVIDCPITSHKQEILDSISPNPRRKFLVNPSQHVKDFGNNARRYAFDNATGVYVLDIDDDDYYADDRVFETLTQVTGIWAVFPVLAYGKRCHPPKPGLGLTGSAMFMYRRDTGMKFPDNASYSADGQLVEALKAKYPYESLDDSRELVIYPKGNQGRDQDEIDAWARRPGKLKYKSDGLTVDWNDSYHRR